MNKIVITESGCSILSDLKKNDLNKSNILQSINLSHILKNR